MKRGLRVWNPHHHRRTGSSPMMAVAGCADAEPKSTGVPAFPHQHKSRLLRLHLLHLRRRCLPTLRTLRSSTRPVSTNPHFCSRGTTTPYGRPRHRCTDNRKVAQLDSDGHVCGPQGKHRSLEARNSDNKKGWGGDEVEVEIFDGRTWLSDYSMAINIAFRDGTIWSVRQVIGCDVIPEGRVNNCLPVPDHWELLHRNGWSCRRR